LDEFASDDDDLAIVAGDDFADDVAQALDADRCEEDLPDEVGADDLIDESATDHAGRDGDDDVLAMAAAELIEEMGAAALPSVLEAVLACTISGLGYVTCSMAPFDRPACLGRVTTWPSHRAMEQRSLSLRC
jgi:hypothetical protein